MIGLAAGVDIEVEDVDGVELDWPSVVRRAREDDVGEPDVARCDDAAGPVVVGLPGLEKALEIGEHVVSADERRPADRSHLAIGVPQLAQRSPVLAVHGVEVAMDKHFHIVAHIGIVS